MTHLRKARPGAVDRRRLSRWQELRNVMAVALHLGAGPTPLNVRELPLSAPVAAGARDASARANKA